MTPVIISKFSPQVLAFHESMYDNRITPGFICILGKNDSKPYSKNFKHIVFLEEGDLYTNKGLIFIKKFIDRFTTCGIISVSEALSLWLRDNESALSKNTVFMIPDRACLKRVLSKENQINAAVDSGLPVLPTYLINDNPDTYTFIKEDLFPLCLRPSGPKAVTPYFKVELTNSPNDLASFIKKRKINNYIIGQPFLNLPNLLVHGARKPGGPTIDLTGFLVERKFEGLALTVRKIDLPETLINGCKKFTEIMDVQGIYHFDFLYDNRTQQAWFLELNNRLGGTTAKVHAIGYDEPAYLLNAFGWDINIAKSPSKKTAADKATLIKYALSTLLNNSSPLDYPIGETKLQRLIKVIKGFFTYKDDIIQLKDLRGTLSFYRDIIKNQLR